MNEKALILLKVAEWHLPNETEHRAVIGDSGTTSTTCCLIHRWPFTNGELCTNGSVRSHKLNILGTMAQQSCPCVVPLIPVELLTKEDTTGCEFIIQDSDCLGRCQCPFCVALRPPLDFIVTIPWRKPVLLPAHSVLPPCLLGRTWLTPSSFPITNRSVFSASD